MLLTSMYVYLHTYRHLYTCTHFTLTQYVDDLKNLQSTYLPRHVEAIGMPDQRRASTAGVKGDPACTGNSQGDRIPGYPKNTVGSVEI